MAWSCLAAAAALALGLVRLAALPLLGAALGSWGAKKARRKAQGPGGCWGLPGCWGPGGWELCLAIWGCKKPDFDLLTLDCRFPECTAFTSCTSKTKTVGVRASPPNSRRKEQCQCEELPGFNVEWKDTQILRQN